jgi:hypothetical protein
MKDVRFVGSLLDDLKHFPARARIEDARQDRQVHQRQTGQHAGSDWKNREGEGFIGISETLRDVMTA